MNTEIVIGNKTFELKASVAALKRLESYFGNGWKWFKEMPRIMAEGPTIEEAETIFRAFLVVPAEVSRPTPFDVGVIFSTSLNTYVKAYQAAQVALAEEMSLEGQATENGNGADPR